MSPGASVTRAIVAEAIGLLTDKYGIDMSRLGRFFEDTLGLAIEL
jgi:hypothetical protein